MSRYADDSEDSLQAAPLPPFPFAQPIKKKVGGKEKQESGHHGGSDETLGMLREMEQMHDNIERRMDEVLKLTGWSPKFLRTYLANPNNFGRTAEWEEAQRKLKELGDSIKTPKQLKQEQEAAKKQSKIPRALQSSPELPSAAKERRTKTAGQRRNWLPMR